MRLLFCDACVARTRRSSRSLEECGVFSQERLSDFFEALVRLGFIERGDDFSGFKDFQTGCYQLSVHRIGSCFECGQVFRDPDLQQRDTISGGMSRAESVASLDMGYPEIDEKNEWSWIA